MYGDRWMDIHTYICVENIRQCPTNCVVCPTRYYISVGVFRQNVSSSAYDSVKSVSQHMMGFPLMLIS